MKIVVAPDSFKGSLSAVAASDAMASGIKRVLPDTEMVMLPLADGGEGTVAALVSSTGGRFQQCRVMGPLGDPVDAEYGILGDGTTAVIEMAAASGLTLIPTARRNPLLTTTYGTGQLLLAALGKGCRKILAGIGGSATSDCGTGMAQALGVKFFRRDGSPILEPMTGERMGEVGSLDASGCEEKLRGCEITVACDVENPLLGPQGAVMVFGRQKGADEAGLERLEANMQQVIGVIENAIGMSVRHSPGSGAAGGLGAGLMAFAHAALKPGIELVLDACNFAEKIAGAHWIFTGEGRVDQQTAMGKTISGMARAAHQQGIPVIVVAGSVAPEADNLYPLGVASMFSICSGPMTAEEAMRNAAPLLSQATERILRAMVASL